jgi:hypothetical protein
MSEENNSPEQQPSSEKKPTAKYSEKHTPENTSMKHRQDPRDFIIRDLTEKEIEDGYMTIFMGNTKASREHAHQLIRPYMDLIVIRDLHQRGKVEDDILRKAEDDWARFVETNYPEHTLEEITTRAQHLMEFHNEILDELRQRSNAIREPGITNVSDRGGVITGDVVGRTPGLGTKGLKPSAIMRRRSARAEDGKMAFDIMLRNSFIKSTIARPGKGQLGILIDEIKDEIKGYVRKVNNNMAVLARIAVGRVLWRHYIKLLTSTSVNDIADYNQLARIVRWSDIDAIAVGILNAYTNKGVNLHLVCGNPTCDWNRMGLADVEKLLHIRPDYDTDEEAAIFANLFNEKATYTSEETLALIRETKYGLEDKRVYNEDNSICLELESPSMADAFASLDFFLGRVNPLIQGIRERNISMEEFEEKRNMLFIELGATEYMHWVSAFISVAAPGSDEKDVVLRRSDVEDQADFNEGVMDIIQDSQYLQENLTQGILRKTPFMSKTFAGVQNYCCPKCKMNQDIFEDPEGLKQRKLGYTPIDPLMSFFILIQLIQVRQATEALEARAKALSALEN